MNIPNTITLARIAAIPVVVVLVERGAFSPGWSLPLTLFFVSMSDTLDGQIARRCNLVTDLGKLLDPLADKLLVLAILLIILAMNIPDVTIPGWSVVVILGREFMVNGLRSLAAAKGRILAASMGGKVKTFLTMLALTLLLFGGPEPYTKLPLHIYGLWLYWAAVVVTVLTGIQYFWINRDLLQES